MAPTPIVLPPPALASPFNPSRLILKLMSALPALCEYSGVPVHDLKSVDQWQTCGNACLLKVGLAKDDGPKKEVYQVIAIWLRVIATTHQEDVSQVTMLVQQWFNMFGRWPITIAFFVSCVPTGEKAGADKVPAGLRGDMYDAAMWFKTYLTELAQIHYALPMIPVFWEDNFALRISLSRVLHSNPQLSPNLADRASHALESRAESTNPHALGDVPTQSDTTVQGLQNLSLGSPRSSEDASTPRGTDASDADESEVDPYDGGRGDISEHETSRKEGVAAVAANATTPTPAAAPAATSAPSTTPSKAADGSAS